MGTPATITARQTPVGSFLVEGHQVLLCFAEDPDIELWEKTVKPFGLDGGDMIEITTQHNTVRRTYAPQDLYKATDSEMTVAYDPKCLSSIQAMIGVEQAITIHHPNGDAWADYGVLRTFEPANQSVGEFPEATCSISWTGRDLDGNEVDPVYDAAGTGT